MRFSVLCFHSVHKMKTNIHPFVQFKDRILVRVRLPSVFIFPILIIYCFLFLLVHFAYARLVSFKFLISCDCRTHILGPATWHGSIVQPIHVECWCSFFYSSEQFNLVSRLALRHQWVIIIITTVPKCVRYFFGGHERRRTHLRSTYFYFCTDCWHRSRFNYNKNI